jgi:signal transduction histidine kinase
MTVAIPNRDVSAGKLSKKWSSNQLSEQSNTWESFVRLWERAHLFRSFIWSQEIADEKTLFKQFLVRVRRFFSVDFCFVALSLEGGKILQLAFPEDSISHLPPNFVRRALDLIANSRVPVTWKQLSKDSGFKSVVISPLSPAVGQPLGFFMLGHRQSKLFTRPELFLLQSLAGELSWAVRELRSKQNCRKLLATLSHELKNSLSVVMGDCTLLREDLEQSPAQEACRQISDIETTSQEILSLVNSFLDSPVSREGKTVVAQEHVELIAFLEDALMLSREQAKRSGVELKVDYADDLPQEISTDLVRFRHVVRGLTDYAIEYAREHSAEVCVKKNGELLEFTVAGIPAQKVKESAEPLFETGRPNHPQDIASPSRLELLKENVNLLMGHVHVISRERKGSDITVCVPCA